MWSSKSQDSVHKPQPFWRERRAEVVWNWGPSAYQPNALPSGQTGSLIRIFVFKSPLQVFFVVCFFDVFKHSPRPPHIKKKKNQKKKNLCRFLSVLELKINDINYIIVLVKVHFGETKCVQTDAKYVLSLSESFLPGWVCTQKNSDTTSLSLYPEMFWHHQDQSVPKGIPTPLEWVCNQKYSDTTRMSLYPDCYHHQHESLTRNILSPLEWVCSQRYAVTTRMSLWVCTKEMEEIRMYKWDTEVHQLIHNS